MSGLPANAEQRSVANAIARRVGARRRKRSYDAAVSTYACGRTRKRAAVEKYVLREQFVAARTRPRALEEVGPPTSAGLRRRLSLPKRSCSLGEDDWDASLVGQLRFVRKLGT
jgi:hypothetical protein